MPDYSKGQIYTIRKKDDDGLIYVGSTINPLYKRFYKHKTDIKNNKVSLYKWVENWDDWYIELFEKYPCNSVQELRRREGEVIREIGNINQNIAGRTPKEWYIENQEARLEYKKKDYKRNYERILENNRTYCENNREKTNQYKRTWAKNNPEKVKEKNRLYREQNKEKIKWKNGEIIECICGSKITYSKQKRHQQTQKHQNWVKENVDN